MNTILITTVGAQICHIDAYNIRSAQTARESAFLNILDLSLGQRLHIPHTLLHVLSRPTS